jgi:hypothetical protein
MDHKNTEIDATFFFDLLVPSNSWPVKWILLVCPLLRSDQLAIVVMVSSVRARFFQLQRKMNSVVRDFTCWIVIEREKGLSRRTES